MDEREKLKAHEEHASLWFDRLVRECAERGVALSRQRASRGDLRPLLLWHRPGGLELASHSPGEGWQLAHGQGKGLTMSVPFSQYADWTRRHAMDLPIV